MNDQEAITKLKTGDIRGLETLVRKYQLEAVRIAFPITNDLGLAEEVVQEAFIRVYQNIDQFDDARPFRPWFLRIVVNDALKMVKRQSRFIPLEPVSDGSEDDDRYADEANLLKFEQAEFSEAQIDAKMLRELLAYLSPEHRAVLHLKYYRSLSEEEIADLIQVPIGTVKSRLHAAKEKLRCLLFRYEMFEVKSCV